jgi:surface polysaccharide O-acyltransferase-like enzyme
MNLKSNSQQRNSQLELLRILCMLAIVAYHYSTYGFYEDKVFYSCNKSFIELLQLLGETGVSIFVLISGYFMVNSNYSFKKFMAYIGQIWFYTIGALLVFVVFFPDSGLVDREMLSMSILPISKGHYWFATCFFVLMLLSPFLNTFIKSASRRELLSAIWIMLAVNTVLPSLFSIQLTYSTIARFIILYLTAGYVRLYLTEPRHKNRSLCWALFLMALAIVWEIVCNHLGFSTPDDYYLGRANIFSHNTLYVYLLALSIFMTFMARKPFYSKGVNALAALTFGVYLFHENQLVRSIWQSVFHTSDYMNSPYVVLHAVIAILSVYIAGSAVELIRQKTVARLWTYLTDKLFVPAWEKLLGLINKYLPTDK